MREVRMYSLFGGFIIRGRVVVDFVSVFGGVVV